MNSKVAHFDFQRTPGDFGAQLLESNEIKRLSPLYNRRLRRTRKLFSFEVVTLPSGYQAVSIRQTNSEQSPDENVGLFRSPRQASKKLEKLADDYFLCFKLLGLEGHPEDRSPCFRRQLKRCFGACEGAESPQDYNARLNVAMSQQQLMMWPFNTPVLVEEQDPADAEFKHFHLIDQWRYFGRIENEDDLREHGYSSLNTEGALHAQESQSAPQPYSIDSACKTNFDLDIYYILLRFLFKPEQLRLNQLRVHPLQKVDSQTTY
jgi:DNA polymerase-3 subunit epsilon